MALHGAFQDENVFCKPRLQGAKASCALGHYLSGNGWLIRADSRLIGPGKLAHGGLAIGTDAIAYQYFFNCHEQDFDIQP